MRRILLRLVVVAVMGAMLLVMAVPAFADTVYDPAGEGARVQPHRCTEFGTSPPLPEPFERCVHGVFTPSGNSESLVTVENPDPDQAPDQRFANQINPSDSN